MSLINQMLKDLEQRHSPENAEKKILSDLHSPRDENKSELDVEDFKKVSAVIFIGILVVILFVLSVYKKNKPVSQPLLVIKTTQAKVPSTWAIVNELPVYTVAPPANVEIPNVPAAGDLTDIKIEGDTNLTAIRFLFSIPMWYSIKQDDAQTFSFLLDNVTYQGICKNNPDPVKCFNQVLPGQIQNDLIQHVDVSFPETNQIKFKLSVNKEATLKSLETSESPAAIVLTFANPKAPSGIQTGTNAPLIKTMTPASNDEEYQAALNMITENHLSQGLTQLQAMLARDPNYAPARVALATLYMKLGRIHDAECILQVGRGLTPNYPSFIELQARIEMSQHCLPQALNLLLSTNPPVHTNLSYYALMAALYQQLNQPAKAVVIYQRLLEEQPYNAIWWLGMGISLEADNRNNMAVEAYRKAKNSARLSPLVEDYIDSRLRVLGG